MEGSFGVEKKKEEKEEEKKPYSGLRINRSSDNIREDYRLN